MFKIKTLLALLLLIPSLSWGLTFKDGKQVDGNEKTRDKEFKSEEISSDIIGRWRGLANCEWNGRYELGNGIIEGVIIVSFASTFGACICFLLSRYLLRDFINNKFEKTKVIIDNKFSKNGIYYLLSLRLIPTISFVLITILFYKNLKISEINSLWSSMAKETAHQIGTPLSSLIGWIELIKNKSKNTPYINEIEKDVNRLTTISERFGKIGSKPKLEKHDLAIEIGTTVKYLNERISNKIKIDFKQIESNIYAKINPQLFSWCLENIIKNSIDAIKEKGKVSIRVSKVDGYVKIFISDNGVGINKSIRNKIFNPGITTKERGWGLGLSLTKRIIEEYHNGEIKVEESSIGQGTKMMIKLKGIE